MRQLYDWIKTDPVSEQKTYYRFVHYQDEHDYRWFEGKEPDEICLEKLDHHGHWICLNSFEGPHEIENILHLINKA